MSSPRHMQGPTSAMTSPSDPQSYFREDYFTARQQFLALAGEFGGTVTSHAIAAGGPAGEPLFIDVAELPGRGEAAGRTVVVSSGLHGVEGFLGSVVQCGAVKQVVSAARKSFPRLVLIHALNPYGFAWIRRCNEANVDLNRNFPSLGNAYRGSPADYGVLDRLLNKRAPPSRWEPFQLLAAVAILRYGLPRLKRAIATGQYDYPQGLFYGGNGPCETTRFVQAQFATWLGTSQEILHLDLHTGLGDWGNYQLLADLPPSPEWTQRIRLAFSREVLCGQHSPAVAYSARGSISEWCQTEAAGRNYQYLCVEFGTYPPTKVLAALRAENRAQHWDRPGSTTYRWAKGLLKEAFCPESPLWRSRAAAQGMELIWRAIGDGM